jgi:hypothetical protein
MTPEILALFDHPRPDHSDLAGRAFTVRVQPDLVPGRADQVP